MCSSLREEGDFTLTVPMGICDFTLFHVYTSPSRLKLGFLRNVLGAPCPSHESSFCHTSSAEQRLSMATLGPAQTRPAQTGIFDSLPTRGTGPDEHDSGHLLEHVAFGFCIQIGRKPGSRSFQSLHTSSLTQVQTWSFRASLIVFLYDQLQ